MVRKKIINQFWPAIVYGGLILFLVYLVTPFMWTVLTSFQPYEFLTSVPPRITFRQVELSYYTVLFFDPQFRRALINSVIVISSATILCMVLATLGCYAVYILPSKGKSLLLFGLLSIQLAPALALLIPLFVLLKAIRLVDTFPGLLITFLLFQVPVGIWLLRGFFSNIPRDLFDAAKVDGCGRLGILFRIAVPLARPGIVAVGIYTFITGWGELLIPITLSVYKWQMLTVYASAFGGLYHIDYGGATAVAVLSAIPSVLSALFFRKQLIRGLTAGAIKG